MSVLVELPWNSAQSGAKPYLPPFVPVQLCQRLLQSGMDPSTGVHATLAIPEP